MSEHAHRSTRAADSVTLETGLEALQSGSEFRGPAAPPDGHYCNDHFAQIHESDAERFAAAVPFVRHGLEAGERVMYVVETHREATVRDALRDGDIDVDAALEAGQLSFHTPDETYLRNETFDPDEMIAFYEEAVAAATADHDALRIVAETTWLDPDVVSFEQFMEYESRVNRLFAAEDCLALCQYDRRGFSPEFIQRIIESHPHLIYDGTVCHNVYYTPPAEVFDDDPAREVDRMLGTLRDRAEAKAELQQRDRFLQALYAITADPTRSFDEKIDALLDLGCEQLGLEVGGVNRVDADADHFEVEYLNADHECFEPGAEFPLSQTYCQAAAGIKTAAVVADPVEEDLDDIPVFEKFGIEGYLGTYIPVDGGTDRTLGFLPAESESVSFSEQDRTCIELMGQWLGYELNRRQREEFLRECYDVTSDPDREFEDKVHALLDLGCEQFGLEYGGMARIDPERDLLEVETMNGDHDHLSPGKQAPLSETHCRLLGDHTETVSVADAVADGLADTRTYAEYGVNAYLGTRVPLADSRDTTLFFFSSESRDTPFTDAERTFVHLMGQWVKYEREHRQRERELERALDLLERTEHIANVGGWEIDPDTRDVFWTDHVFDLLEVSGDDEPPLDEALDMYHEDDRSVVADAVETALDSGEAFDVEARIRTGGAAEERWLRLQGEPETVDDEVVLLRGAAQDITDRKEHARRLEQKNDRLESFASMLAHELRNPVTIGQIYARQFPEGTDADAVEYVREAFDRIEDMIDVMLVLTRGREAVDDCTPVDLGATARAAWGEVDAPDASLDVAVDQTIPADETYIQHLFQNLLENAVEHGGADVRVAVGSLADADGFYVADDGPGIPAEDRDCVFDEGYTTAGDTGGTGLGLAFVRKLADVYEWDCRVTESDAGGARFELRNVT